MDHLDPMDPDMAYFLDPFEQSNDVEQPSLELQLPRYSWDVLSPPMSLDNSTSASEGEQPKHRPEHLASNAFNTKPMTDINSPDIAPNQSMMGEKPSTSPSMEPSAANSMVDDSPSTKKLYECPTCHMGERSSAKSDSGRNENTAGNRDENTFSGFDQPSYRLGKPKNVWQRPTCLQKHILEYHIYTFKRFDSQEFICWLCPCTWYSGCNARFKNDSELLKHVSTSHSEPAEPHHHFHHSCDPLSTDSGSYKTLAAQDVPMK